MLAVVLSIGLVVDDAIVMTENIYIRIERGMSPVEAGIEGAKEIFFAVVSTTVTLVAVFLPIVFMEGMTGRLFTEFALVIAGSVIISSIAALIFTPMLATKLLRKHDKKNWLYRKTEPFFEWLNRWYGGALGWFLHRRWLVFPIMALMMFAIFYYWNSIPSELAPMEDRSMITVRISGQEGSTFEYVRDYADRVADIADSVASERKAILSRSWNGSGFLNVVLPNIKDRRRSQMEIASALGGAIRGETQARAFVNQQSTFGGNRGGLCSMYCRLQASKSCRSSCRNS